MTGYAYCRLCEKNVDINYDRWINPQQRIREKNYMVPLKCGHIFDWETGHCFIDKIVELKLNG